MQRQKLPASAWVTSSRVGRGFRSIRALADISQPGVQNPHCTAPCAIADSWSLWSRPPWPNPSMVVISLTLHRTACEIAVAARDANGSGQVAGSLGPLGWSYRPDLAPPSAQAAELYTEICRLQEPYVDLFLCETMCSVDQARGVLAGALVLDKPVWLALSVDDADGSRLRSGEALVDILPLLVELPPAAVLINCSVPEALDTAIPLLVGQGIPVGGYANGFVNINSTFTEKHTPVDALVTREDLDPLQYANFAQHWLDAGATIIGGCCEVGPAHIAELVRRFK